MRIQFDPTLAERHTRRPSHNFATESHFWEIQPFLCAPVLPGETLDSLTIQSRVVTPPLKSRVVGWWLEYYIFYVPFRLMPAASSLVAMFVDPTVTLSPTAAAAHRYYNGNGYDYISQCLQVVTQEWFRREGENWSSFTIRANRPAATHAMDTWMESLISEAGLPAGATVASLTNLDDLERARIVLDYRRSLATMGGDGGAVDYEEVLASYGASLKIAKERERPELLRYIREWTYPTNTVEPTTGTPTTAASWAVKDRADKKRRFQEPGFIFGVQIIRPKIYFANLGAPAASFLDNAQAWLPPAMENAGEERSLKELTANGGPVNDGVFGTNYWVDVRDLFNYGDQYLDATATAVNAVALPTTGQANRYASLTIANGLLQTADQLTVSDGNVQLNVKTRTVDPS